MPNEPRWKDTVHQEIAPDPNLGVTVRKIVDIYRRQKNKNSPLAFVLPWF